MTKKIISTEREHSWQPPVVTVMGHVDHGKTTLLDTIRHTEVAAGEAGGITQHIGAYSVEFQGKRLTFIDTPGHEAFSAMRSRGGRVADVIVLVIDAVEGVRPQTLEALAQAQSYGVPIIVALNKMDLPDANPGLVKNQLAQNGLLVEGFGGETVVVEISAKTGQNIDQLLEMIVLTAELHPSTARAEAPLEAYVIESRLDRQRGPVASVVVKNGHISLGDEVWSGEVSGKVKQIIDDHRQRLDRILPGEVGEMLGFGKVPVVGEKVSRTPPVSGAAPASGVPVASVLATETPTLRLVIKADVSGSLEALKETLIKVLDFKDKTTIIFLGLGDVNDSDVNLARATSAVIVAFRVKVLPSSAALAESLKVEIRSYQIIYKVAEEIEAALKGLNAWQKSEGRGLAKVLRIFPLESGDRVLGCRLVQGTLSVGLAVRLLRETEEIGRSRIKSLHLGKERVTKVSAEEECGLLLADDFEAHSGDEVTAI